MRKGDLNQVFVYLMVVIVVGAVLILGYRAIINLLDQKCGVEQSSFRTDMQDAVDTYAEPGAQGDLTLYAPCDYEELCFTGTGATVPPDNKYSMIGVELDVGTGNNVFLVTGTQARPVMKIPNMDVNDPSKFLCVKKVGGQFKFVMRGIVRGQLQIDKQ